MFSCSSTTKFSSNPSLTSLEPSIMPTSTRFDVPTLPRFRPNAPFSHPSCHSRGRWSDNHRPSPSPAGNYVVSSFLISNFSSNPSLAHCDLPSAWDEPRARFSKPVLYSKMLLLDVDYQKTIGTIIIEYPPVRYST